ncbi:SCO family protein [Algoriphagus sp. SE2]|uniref:SCO family protein n=1 Tax=Algoriphagus sp. SE2 TaxID=3141536 RepID=UPI0031CCF8C2
MNKLILITGFLTVLIGCDTKLKKTSRVDVLPYYNEATFTPKWFGSQADVPVDFHKIPPFNLQNQQGKTVTQKDVEGKIYVVDFFFTSCPGICPKMTSNMSIIQEEFINDDELLILSHSVTPEFDNVTILREYADAKGVVDSKWYLLTGDRAQIYDLGRNQYFVEEDLGLEKDPDDFIHSENFILIDQNRYIRGIYNGLNKTSVNQLIADINTLKSEI